MKRSIFITTILIIISHGIVFATDIDLRKDPPPSPVPTTPVMMLPVSATIDASELAVYFEATVGETTITVYDAANNLVYQQTIDTASVLEVHIPADTWTNGDYTITISYGTNTVRGVFQTE